MLRSSHIVDHGLFVSLQIQLYCFYFGYSYFCTFDSHSPLNHPHGWMGMKTKQQSVCATGGRPKDCLKMLSPTWQVCAPLVTSQGARFHQYLLSEISERTKWLVIIISSMREWSLTLRLNKVKVAKYRTFTFASKFLNVQPPATTICWISSWTKLSALPPLRVS